MVSSCRLRALFIILGGAAAFACVEVPNPPLADCGKFGFSPSTDANVTGQAALFELTFTHIPKNCPIACGNYWFVQALRPWDSQTGEFIQPNNAQQGRMVVGQTDDYFNGWAIDRKSGRHLGWYGVTDQFSLEPASGIPGEVFQVGLGSTPAMMHDALARGDRWKGKTLIVLGITAAVALDPGTACENKILGVQKWMVLFRHDDATQKDLVETPTLLASGHREFEALTQAVDQWNNHLDDGRVRLPWASGPGFSLP